MFVKHLQEFLSKFTEANKAGTKQGTAVSNAKIYIDKSLISFKEIWAAAGHPFCVYKCTYNDLISHSKGIESDLISI